MYSFYVSLLTLYIINSVLYWLVIQLLLNYLKYIIYLKKGDVTYLLCLTVYLILAINRYILFLGITHQYWPIRISIGFTSFMIHFLLRNKDNQATCDFILFQKPSIVSLNNCIGPTDINQIPQDCYLNAPFFSFFFSQFNAL